MTMRETRARLDRLRRAAIVCLSACLLALVFIAVAREWPLWAGLRQATLWLVLGGALAAAPLLRRLRAPWLVWLIWLAIPLTLGVEAARVEARQARVLAAPREVVRELGRHFIIGFTDIEEAAALAERGLIAGVFIARGNVAGKSAAALRAEIAGLQHRRRAAGLAPLIVAADQEGGPVSHLTPPAPPAPPLAAIAALPPAEWDARARAQGAAMGAALAHLGVTVNFAPVVDLRPQAPPGVLDLYSRIGTRAISDDPETVARIAGGFVAGLQGAGVRATLKHFPGLGRVSGDTHFFPAHLRASAEELAGSDWRPFRDVLAREKPMLMLGHVTLDALDPAHPASQSPAVLAMLREWGFDGVAITDDLAMGAAFPDGACAGVARALNAGVDLLLASFDPGQFYELMDCALTAQARGALDAAALAASRDRLDKDE